MGYGIYVYDKKYTKVGRSGSFSYTGYSKWLDVMGAEFSDLWFETVSFGDMRFSLNKQQAHIIHRAILDVLYKGEYSEDIMYGSLMMLELLELVLFYNGVLEAS